MAADINCRQKGIKMRGMNARTTHYFRGENPDREFVQEKVTVIGNIVHITGPNGNLLIENGNRIATSRIVRPKPAPEIDLRYKVTGWDHKMNTVNKVVDSMKEALDLAENMLHARIKPKRR